MATVGHVQILKFMSVLNLVSLEVSVCVFQANVRGNSPNQVPKMSARYGSWMFYMTEPGSVSIFRAFP